MKKPNERLRYQRERWGWLQKKVADLIDTNKEMISRWECGERAPSKYYQEKLFQLFQLSAEDLGLIDAPQCGQDSYPSQNAYSMLNISREYLDHAETIIDLAWEAWFASHPQKAGKEINKILPDLVAFLHKAPSAYMLRLKELIIRSHGLLGAINLDALQNDSALYHYIQAHKYAEDISDTTLTVTYLALIGDVLRRQNEKSAAISHMELARDHAQAADKVTQGHILQLLAYTYADTGNAQALEKTIQQATDVLSFSGEGRDTARKEFNPFEIYEIRGKAYRDLGRPTEAIPYLDLAEKSLERTEAIIPRWHALLEISRGQAYCDVGDLTTGVDIASKRLIMAYQCHSLRQMNRVRKLVRKLESETSPWKHHKKVAELKEVVHDTYLRLEF